MVSMAQSVPTDIATISTDGVSFRHVVSTPSIMFRILCLLVASTLVPVVVLIIRHIIQYTDSSIKI